MDPLIWTKNQVLSSDFCRHVIDKFEKDSRKCQGRSGLVPSENTMAKQSTDLHISSFTDWKNEDNVFFESLIKQSKEYYEHVSQCGYFVTSGNDVIDSGYQIQRTLPGEQYTWHHDFCLYSERCRDLTYIWYLNDVHEDGYTEFLNGSKIQPEEGKILIFPSTWTYVHRGYPPKSETKYIVTGWISSSYK